MGIARSTGAFIGTDESTPASIANGASASSGEIDLLGDNASAGEVRVYAVVTSAVTTGSIDVSVASRRASGQAYTRRNPDFSLSPVNGTVKYDLGVMSVGRLVDVTATNNATGAGASVFVGYELVKYS